MDSHRVISISINEQDYQAFIRVQPQPVLWLREKIQESIAVSDRTTAGPSSAAAAANTTSATTR